MGVCAAESCSIVVEPEHLCCLKHWRLVDKETQNEVYRTWRNVRRDPDAYLEAKREAVRQIGEREANLSNPNQGSLFG